MSGLPIFRDERSFHEQTERMFREMEEKMGFHHPMVPSNPPGGLPDIMSGAGTAGRWPAGMHGFDDNAFFQLRPLATPGSLAHQVRTYIVSVIYPISYVL